MNLASIRKRLGFTRKNPVRPVPTKGEVIGHLEFLNAREFAIGDRVRRSDGREYELVGANSGAMGCYTENDRWVPVEGLWFPPARTNHSYTVTRVASKRLRS